MRALDYQIALSGTKVVFRIPLHRGDVTAAVFERSRVLSHAIENEYTIIPAITPDELRRRFAEFITEPGAE